MRYFENWFIWRFCDEFIAPLIFPSWRQRRNYYRGAESNAQPPVDELKQAEDEIRELRQR